ncbi:MAG: MFS transporter, partial [Methanogenium sp.]|nr:MFS transporter [Methanogenium sp.]
MAGNIITGTPADRKISRAELRIILIAVTLASFITPYIGSATNIALPLIGMEFGVDAVTLGWIPTVYLLTSAVFLVPVGRIADMYGLKRIFTIGVGIFTIAAFLCGFATSAPVLIACEVLLGLGGAMIYATGIAILSYAFPASERGRVFGITVAAVYIGLSAGPLIGGVLTVA